MRRASFLTWVVALTATFAASALATTASLTTLATFNGTNGAYPFADLMFDASGNLYGATQQGGSSNKGTVFKIAAGTHTLTAVVAFNGTNGAYPAAGLIADASGNLYGTTVLGGSSDHGTIFKLAAGSNALTTLASFNYTNGRSPLASLISDASGNLYGTAQYGGIGGGSGYGTVFKLAGDTGILTSLVLFNSANGSYPWAGLIADASGNLYGTTPHGGAHTDGTVFRIAAGTNSFTTLLSFQHSVNGSSPRGGLIADAAGNLYGTTVGGFGHGTVYKLDASNNHAITTLAMFNGTNGSFPYARLIADAAGNLYGTTAGSGAINSATVFRLDASTNTITTLATFNGTNGTYLIAGLIADAAGNLYGTTARGGSSDYGTVFKLTNTGFVVPEPSSLVLLACAMICAPRRWRR